MSSRKLTRRSEAGGRNQENGASYHAQRNGQKADREKAGTHLNTRCLCS
eukprot:CAMPEP_0170604884 /NCGR_PEP_ID=MMETSP0224-20130122/19676_1 /TAXON_ID=285029 /ORGANISM="Togula jolla, Strain CCCM 725" /LENGTH=48 /DNA_ID= /DNA_START= /DNA_END= /DNA_ORIENTATION=